MSKNAVEAVDAIDAAAEKERHDLPLAYQLAALDALGGPFARHVTPEALLARAKAASKRKLVKDAAWIPFDDLDMLRWADDTPVDPTIARLLVTHAIKVGNVRSSILARGAFGHMTPESVHTFALTLLELWIAQDLGQRRASLHLAADSDDDAPTSDDEFVDPGDSDDGDVGDGNVDDDSEGAEETASNKAPSSSAIGSKGLLAVVAAGADASILAETKSYVRDWYRRRPAQAKALVEMAGSTEQPDVIQYALSVADRFPTDGMRSRARFAASLLAERLGLALDELAYQKVPTAGFDVDGRLDLDYGPRTFIAKLTDDLEVVLSDEGGATISALPRPRVADNPARVAEAKSALRNAKQGPNLVSKNQQRWLQEAMWVQRQIGLEEFRRFFLGHPVMRRLAGRLVWAGVTGSDRVLFRPLSDGTLIDVADETIELDGVEFVTIAHELLDGVATGEAWRRHFSDYQVVPLFAQFGRPGFPELVPNQTEVLTFGGKVVGNSRLRGAVKHLTLEFGRTFGDGRINLIQQFVHGAKLQVRLSIDGDDDYGATKTIGPLCFWQVNMGRPVLLSMVPPVMLVEVIAAVEQIVAAGETAEAGGAS